MDKIIDYAEARKIISECKQAGRTVIFKSGCFDLIHNGHVQMLKKVKSYADILIIGIGSDITVKRDRQFTFFDEYNRASVIAAFECVNYVVILREENHGNVDHKEFLKATVPNYFYISEKDKQLEEKKKLAESLGITPILHEEMTIVNFGEEIEPHSTQVKTILFT